MKKEVQKEINEIVLRAYDSAMKEVDHHYGIRLRSCNAYVYESEHFYLLRSYNTIIACIHKKSNTMYDFLRYVYGYTSTSAQHISKFRHDYTSYPWNAPVYTWREV